MSDWFTIFAWQWAIIYFPIVISLTLFYGLLLFIDLSFGKQFNLKVRSFLWLSPIILIPCYVLIKYSPDQSLAFNGTATSLDYADLISSEQLQWSFAIWLVITGGLITYYFWQQLLLWRKIQQDNTYSQKLQLLAQSCSLLVGLKKTPEVIITKNFPTPFVVGLIKPTVIIPEKFSNYPELVCKQFLLHELTHIRQADQAQLWLINLAKILLWPVLLMPIVGKQCYQIRELLCDQKVFQNPNNNPSDYWQSISIVTTDYLKGHNSALSNAWLSSELLLLKRLKFLQNLSKNKAQSYISVSILITSSLALVMWWLTEQSQMSSDYLRTVYLQENAKKSINGNHGYGSKHLKFIGNALFNEDKNTKK